MAREEKRWGTYSDAINIGLFFLAIVLVGLVLVMLGVSTGGSHGAALLWALACLVFGGTLGFLFGIPRVLQPTPQSGTTGSNQQPGSSTDATLAPVYQQQVNTGLERVSEWLTTMLVGLGLAQLGSISTFLDKGGTALESVFGTGAYAKPFGQGLLVFFSLAGFLGSYMMTRLVVASAFGRADTRPITSVAIRANLTMEETIALNNSRMSFGEGGSELSGTAQVAAQKILNLPFESLETPYDFALWGKAQLEHKDFKNAVRAYARASSLATYDVEVQFEYAVALSQDSATFNQITDQLMTAYRGIRPETSSDLIKNIYKGLTYEWLYHGDARTAFTQATKYGEEYTSNKRSLPSGGIWVNLACAYGQKMTWLKADPSNQTGKLLTNSQEQSETFDQAVNAVRQAIQLDPTWKATFERLLDGADPKENDLVIFRDDQNFKSDTGL